MVKQRYTPGLDGPLNGLGGTAKAQVENKATTLPADIEGPVAPLKSDWFYALQVISPIVAIFDSKEDLKAFLIAKKARGYEVAFQHWVLSFPRGGDEQVPVKRQGVMEFFGGTL